MDLEENESVVRWFKDVAFERSGSLSTRDLYLKVLRLFCGFVGKSPDEIVSECEKYDK